MTTITCYEGVYITVDERGRFNFKDSENEYQGYETLVAAKEAVDKLKRETVAAQKRPLALAVITNKGQRTTIKGIHASQKILLVTDKEIGKEYHKPDLYVDCPRAVQLLNEVTALYRQLKPLEKELLGYEIKWNRSEGYSDRSELGVRYDKLEAEYKHKAAAGQDENAKVVSAEEEADITSSGNLRL